MTVATVSTKPNGKSMRARSEALATSDEGNGAPPFILFVEELLNERMKVDKLSVLLLRLVKFLDTEFLFERMGDALPTCAAGCDVVSVSLQPLRRRTVALGAGLKEGALSLEGERPQQDGIEGADRRVFDHDRWSGRRGWCVNC